MTGYKYEVWADFTGSQTLYCARVTDPNGELVGEVRSLSEETSLKLAYVLKTEDKSRFAAANGVFN